MLRLVVLLEHFGWDTAIEGAVRTAIWGYSVVKATDFPHVQKSQPDTRDRISINPVLLPLVVMVMVGKKYSAEKHGPVKM